VTEQDTIFAVSSGRPPAAVSIIRISGPRAQEAGSAIAGALPEPRMASLRELRHPSSGELLDQALVLRFDSPASATGENVVEFQCHGGRAVVDAILDALASVEGLRAAEPGEFTRRSFENGRIDLTEAEGLADLIEAETQSQRRNALALAEGGLRRRIQSWQERLVGLSAEAERRIDYADEDSEPDTIEDPLQRSCMELASELQWWLARPRAERLKGGVTIVFAGPPNAGKSSLVNALVGEERAIVTDIPGTTRDYIEVPLAIGGVPAVLIDTAGLRDGADEVEAIGVARAAELIKRADILVWLGEPLSAPVHARTILVHAKSDLPSRQSVPRGSLAVSSILGSGIPELLGELKALSLDLLPGEDAIALNRRQAECVEEAAEALIASAQALDLVLVAEGLRVALRAFDRLTGRAGVEDVLDALFSRFCLGK
jgi:tRNA modification GTPase